MFSRIPVLTCALAALVLDVASAHAQSRATTGDIVGVVLDQTQAAVPGATVNATNLATNISRSAVTMEDGRFVIAALPPATYRVDASAPGFSRQAQTAVVVALGSVVDLSFTLAVGAVTETVDVVAPASLLDLQRTAISTVVSQAFIDNLPINGRNFISFSVITPGVSVDRTPQQGASATSGLTFAGQRGRSNNIVIDGLDNNDATVGGVRATFSQEAVQEFQVLANSFSAEFGKASGGIVNIVTKSGTNRRQGSAFFFLRDEALNAREHFERLNPAGERIDRIKAPYSQKQFGGTFGGPLRQDATFYFLSFERADIDASNFVTIDDRSVVTALGRDFGTLGDVLQRAGFPVQTGHVPYRNDSTQFLARVDHRAGPSHTLTARFNWAGGLNETIEPWGGQVARSRGALLDSDDAMLAASYLSTPSSAAVNEFRSQLAYRDQAVLALDPRCDGLCDRLDEGGPTLEIGGVAQIGRQRFTPQPRRNLRFQVLDTFSHIRGSHSVKAGFDYSNITSFEGSLPLHFGGRYIFSPLPAIPGVLPAPVSAVQALALGLPAGYVQGYGDPESAYRVQDIALFVQDEWTPAQDLTLKLGLRYQKQFWDDAEYTVGHVGTYSFPADSNDIAPRLAVAWNPWRDGKTSLHGAYGMFYDSQITAVYGISQILTGGADGVRTLVLRFPATLAAWNAPGRQIPEPAASYPSIRYVPDPALRTPYAHHLSLGLNRQLGPDMSMAANLVYVRGHNQIGSLDYNPIVPALGQNRRPDDVLDTTSGQPAAGTSATVFQPTSFGETWYRGLMLSLARRTASAQILASYTLSKAEDNSTDFQTAFIPQNTGRGRNPADPTGLPIGFDPDEDKGPSVQDERHRFVVSGTYGLPAGIQLSSILTIASGRPYNILAGTDLDGNGDGGNFPVDRARRVPDDPTTSVPRNHGTLPVQSAVDLRVSRKFRLVGTATVEAMIDVFNLFNRSNFTDVNNVFGTGAYPQNPLSTFGQFQQAGPKRQAQLAARLTF